MDVRAMDLMLSDLRATAGVATGQAAGSGATGAAGGPDFAQVLKGAMDQVSQAQQSAEQMANNFTSGDSSVNLQDVMLNLQKANVSFQQMVQVRNRLVTAYHDIMNMSI
ncbi:MAG: flagellar hook-basal body complex protein FliE [Rhodocyclaceae bacterium]|nr:flagellar hook-basal body complex protein FliE [Rhodocyclaceae bacterium]